jgi:hypothetical protein
MKTFQPYIYGLDSHIELPVEIVGRVEKSCGQDALRIFVNRNLLLVWLDWVKDKKANGEEADFLLYKEQYYRNYQPSSDDREEYRVSILVVQGKIVFNTGVRLSCERELDDLISEFNPSFLADEEKIGIISNTVHQGCVETVEAMKMLHGSAQVIGYTRIPKWKIP